MGFLASGYVALWAVVEITRGGIVPVGSSG